MAVGIGRRQFISALGGAAFVWPLPARAEQPGMPVIGLLSGAAFDDVAVIPFRKGLNEAGLYEGKNVEIEFQSASGQYDRLPSLAAALVQQNVRVIIAMLATAAALAAKAATSTIPIVFVNGSDPVALGLVGSLKRPGGNLTGITFLTNTLGAKRLELLHELLPAARTIGILVNPNNSNTDAESSDMLTAANTMGLELHVEKASSATAIDIAFARLAKLRVEALVVAADAYYRSVKDQIVATATRLQIPTIYASREFVEAGGLMGYGTSISDAFRLTGIYAGRIVKGEKPADLPVQESVKVELIINLKTANSLGLVVPLTLLGRADEVIE